MAAGEHSYRKFVNPYLADLLITAQLDRRYVRGQGTTLVDDRGRQLVDFVAAFGKPPA